MGKHKIDYQNIGPIGKFARLVEIELEAMIMI